MHAVVPQIVIKFLVKLFVSICPNARINQLADSTFDQCLHARHPDADDIKKSDKKITLAQLTDITRK